MSRNVTLGQLHADIREQADIAGATTRTVASLLTRLVNQSIQRFRERLSTEGATHFLTSVSKTLTAGATSPYPFYALDLSSESPSVVRTYAVDLTVNGVTKTLVHVPFSDRDKYGGPNVKSEPVAWANYQTRSVAIMPAPSSSYSAVVWYLPVLPDLSSLSDTFDGVAGWEDYIKWDVVGSILTRENSPEMFQMAESNKQGVWQDILRSATKVSSAGGALIGRDSMAEKGVSGARRRLLPPP
jgi:hypothetical protein